MKIVQSEKYQGDDWWEWAVWMDGKPNEIKTIQAVTYTLHPTFRNPIQKITDRKSKFKLRSAGWGGFTIYASVELKDRTIRKMKHTLELHYPDGSRTKA